MIEKNSKDLFLRERIIPINGINEVRTEEIAAMVLLMHLQDRRAEIHFLMDSNGGSVQHALQIYDIVKGINTQKKITVIGKCKSAGLIVLSAFEKEKRLCTKHSEFFFHAMRNTYEFISTRPIEKQLEIIQNDIATIMRSALEVMEIGFNLSEEQIKKLQEDGQATGQHLTPKEAIKLGLVSKIVTENII